LFPLQDLSRDRRFSGTPRTRPESWSRGSIPRTRTSVFLKKIWCPGL